MLRSGIIATFGLVVLATTAAPLAAQAKPDPRLNGTWVLDTARSDPMPGASGETTQKTATVVGTASDAGMGRSGTVVMGPGQARGASQPAAAAVAALQAIIVQLRKASMAELMVFAATADTTVITEDSRDPVVWVTDKKKHRLPENPDMITEVESSWSGDALTTTRYFANKLVQKREIRIDSDGQTLVIKVSWSGNGINDSFTLRFLRQ